MTEPTIVQRADEVYLAYPAHVTMETISAAADRLPELARWLGEHDIAPTGAPFFRYDVIDMSRELRMQVGFPVSAADTAAAEGEVIAGVLPAGRYVTMTHVGHPEGLMHATKELLEWADREGLQWDAAPGEGGEHWGCRIEVYRTDPRVEPDLSRWRIDLLFRLRD